MQVNPDWVYRKIHVFHVLINMKTNKILSISPNLKDLFAPGIDFDIAICRIKDSLSANNQQTFSKIIEKLACLGVVSNE